MILIAGNMAKRVADKELTDRNWDQEEEAEDAGTFSVASKDVLKNREIRKAKRRNTGSDSEKGGAFKGFQGLVSSGASFTGFGSVPKPIQGLTNGNGDTSLFSNSKSTTESKPVFGSLFANGPPTSLSSTIEVASTTAKTNGETLSSTSSPAASKPGGSSEYNKQLMSLNSAVRDWIVKHVNATPLCDLTPIFRDYEKHLACIEQKYGAGTDSGSESDSTSKSTPSVPTLFSSNTEAMPTFSFSSKEEKSEQMAKSTTEKKPESASLFSFSKKPDTANFSSFGTGTASTFSFKVGATSLLSNDTSKSSAGTPSFSFQAEASAKKESSGEGEESEEPPKVVIQEVKEDNAFYSKKCKLFYKKDNEFKEKGVGTLHLKPVGDQKTQLLVRADTNLGNILLNILVQPSMPCSRMGKNNVMIVCVPNPPIDEKNPTVPITMLIRVKTTEDADELHKLLLEKKGA
ncbi:PREDICTED: nuclear pore complex protein Nup50 [Nanorana parkeri]|uniref:nuclear pore complex protein Nup50 n=1 Tax=Nanorana parkeri TaxID=125878 RepID=UPI000854852C|nr:PREDICTED: nuclear pore complex protein Nup50 [Nanorana parkeri]